MTVEYSAVYVDDLDPELPESGDDISEGDDHMRLIKNVLLNTFQSATKPLVADFDYLNQIPTRISLTSDVTSDTDSTSILAMDMTTNRLKNITDAYEDQDVPSLAQVKNLITSAFSNALYPVGSVFITRTGSNPADILGFGTWVVVSGGIFGSGTYTSADGTTDYNYISGNVYGSPDTYLQTANIPSLSVDMGATDGNGNPYVNITSVVDSAGINYKVGKYSADGEGSGGELFGETDKGQDQYWPLDLDTGITATSTIAGTIPLGNTNPSPLNIQSPVNVFNIWERTE